MIRRFTAGSLALLVSCAVLGTAGAGAATQIGSDCEATFTVLDSMVAQVSRVTPPAALETAAPGVVTSWRVRTSMGTQSKSQTLKVLKRAGSKFEVLAESAPETVVGGKLNEFLTRIPVTAGASFGAAASGMIPACDGEPGDALARFTTAPTVGGKAEPSLTDPSRLVALAVMIEPDADGDGFGDESQDKCPQSAATQGACPVPPGGGSGTGAKLKGKPKLEGNVVAVKLTTTAATKVTVTGSIRGKRAASPASKTVSPGETGRLYLQLSKGTKQRLANLPRKRKLKMVIEAKVAGAPTVSSEISLPGRKKPQPARAPR